MQTNCKIVTQAIARKPAQVVDVVFEIIQITNVFEWDRILAGGIPGFRIELCCFFHPLAWPLCVAPCCLCFASVSVAILKMTHKMSSCILFLRAGSCPTSLCFVVLVLLWFSVFFVCLPCLWFVFLMGPLTGLCTGPLLVLF